MFCQFLHTATMSTHTSANPPTNGSPGVRPGVPSLRESAREPPATAAIHLYQWCWWSGQKDRPTKDSRRNQNMQQCWPANPNLIRLWILQSAQKVLEKKMLVGKKLKQMVACHEGVVDRHLLFLQQWKGLMERCHSIRPSQGIAWGPSAYQDSPGDDAEIQRQTKRSECQICIPEPNTTMKQSKASQEQPENQPGCATVETHDEDTTLYNVHIYTHLMNISVWVLSFTTQFSIKALQSWMCSIRNLPCQLGQRKTC